MRRTWLCLLCAVVVQVGTSAALAEVPQLVNYQGSLTDTDGIPLHGNHDLTFAIYPDSAQAVPATWTEPHSPVFVDHGLFSVILGGIIPLSDSLFAGDECWLGIMVDVPPEIYPRMQFTSVPWALRAAVADTALEVVGGVGDGHSLNAADGDPVDALYVDDEGRVGIGTTAPTTQLTVNPGVQTGAVISTGTAEGSDGRRLVVAGGGGFGVGRGAYVEAFGSDYWTRPGDLRLMAGDVEGDSARVRLGVGGDYSMTIHPNGGTSLGYSYTSSVAPASGLLVQGSVGIGTTNPLTELDVMGTLRATGFQLPTGASVNRVLTSDASGTASWQPASGGRVPEILYADLYPDSLYADAGEKITAAIADLPAWGGVVDARALTGEQWIQQNMFAGVTISVTLLLGAGTYNISTGQIIDDNEYFGSIYVLGRGNSTIIKPTSGMTVFQVNAGERIRFADMRFDLNSTPSTAIFLRSNRWYGAVVERLWISNSVGTQPMIRVGVDMDIAASIGAVLRDLWLSGPLTLDAIDIGSEMVLVDHVATWGCRAGVRFSGRCTSMTISNSVFHTGRHALLIDGIDIDSLLFMGNDVESGQASEGSIRLTGNAAHFPIHNVIIRDNYFTQLRDPQMDAIYLKYVDGVVIEGNRFGAGFAGSGAECVVFDDDVTNVSISGNIVLGLEPTMPGYESVPLQVNDVTATQSSAAGGFSSGLTVDGVLTAKELLSIKPRLLPPADPTEGDVYMNGTTHKLMVFDGVSWRACW